MSNRGTPQRRGEVTKSNIVAVDTRTYTKLMEQLQEGYVATVAASAGCTMEPIPRDIYGFDVRLVRPGRAPGEEEVTLNVQLKNTTTIKPDLRKEYFSHKLKKREYLETLAAPRTGTKALLVVMVTPPIQNVWTNAAHEYLAVHHCCYWAYLEGRPINQSVESPSVPIPTANIFDSHALASLMDKASRGERLQ